jgi:hypothetical protein
VLVVPSVDLPQEAPAMSTFDLPAMSTFDLPRIGASATRALASVGVTRLSQLTEHRAQDLLNLHGMGPQAMARLRQALADRGLSLRADP